MLRKSILSVAITAGLIQGCAAIKGPSGPIHAYEGEIKSKDQIAKLVATTIPGTTWKSEEQSLFCGVDDKEFESTTRELYLTPGEHTLCVRYSVPSAGFLLDSASYRFDEKLTVYVEAGKKYELNLETVMRGIILDDVHFSLVDPQDEIIASTK